MNPQDPASLSGTESAKQSGNDLKAPWLFTLVTLLAVVFNVVLPKGGFKIDGIPITWGYAVLLGASAVAVAGLLVTRPLNVRWARVATLTLILPCQLAVGAALYFNGWRETGAVAALIVNVFALPIIFVGLFGYWFDRVPMTPVFAAIRWSIILVSAYGIFLFIWKHQTGSFIEIPYVTVNAQDVGLLETKHIRRGNVFKLISTYNNGNVFGVCTLMLLPFYLLLERRVWVHAIVLVAMALTLSRTIWAGVPVVIVLHLAYVQRLTLRRFLMIGGGTLMSLVMAWIAAVAIMGRDLDFLLDSDLGGRGAQFAILHNFEWWPSQPFDGIEEVLYMAWLRNFGLIGLLLLAAALLAPLLVHLWQEATKGTSQWERAAAAGMVTYLFVAWSDAAFEGIPSYAFFWFCASVAISSREVSAAGNRTLDQ